MTDRFLTRAEVDHLAGQLELLPEIEREIAIGLTGQTRMSESNGRSQPRSRPPYPVHLQVLCDDLKTELVSAVRDICESRTLDYSGADTITGAGKWIHHNRFALQLMESGVETFESLCKVIDRCGRTLGQDDAAPLAPAERDRARAAIVTVSTIEAVAKRVGAQGLTSKRLRLLAKKSAVRPVTTAADGSVLYRLGEVLDAHRDMPKRGA
ncbi:helix-turn-helix DNA binding domain protein [Gordonia phage Whitney]|nr:helix-turn-helix DNA binding domain protein [Gordonia phage Whitney]